MADGSSQESEPALRALRSASADIESLRTGSLSPSAARSHIVRVAIAVDRSLRRLLRDDEAVDLSVRLKALAADELKIDGVLAELRKRDRIPVEVAAGVHDLFGIRRRLDSGNGDPEPDDAARAVAVANRLDDVISRGTVVARPAAAVAAPLSPAAAVPLSSAPSRGDAQELDEAAVPARRSTMAVWAILVVTGVAILGFAIAALLARRGPSELELGESLFNQQQYEEAAQYFWRYAEEHPDEVTPHLYLARIHRRMKRPELAAEAIRQAQNRAPDDPGVHRELGFLLLDAGQTETAVTRFREAVELDPVSSEGWVGLVRALRESGHAPEAAAALAQAPAEVRALFAERTVP